MTRRFVVIGAMKSATTTLFCDLKQNPNVHCAEKEDGIFLQNNVSSKQVAAAMQTIGNSHLVFGEVCTKYSMLPNIDGVADRVHRLSGSETKVVYLVRNPIKRTLSHHQHMFNWHGEGRMGPDINLEIQQQPSLADYSKYHMQLKPWMDRFGSDSIHVIRFEDYVADRKSILTALCKFLDVPDQFAPIDSRGANRGEDRLVANRSLLKLYQTDFFRRRLKPMVPNSVRNVLRKLVLGKAEKPSIPPTLGTLEFIFEAVSDDARQFAKLLGRSETLWNLEETLSELRARYELTTC